MPDDGLLHAQNQEPPDRRADGRRPSCLVALAMGGPSCGNQVAKGWSDAAMISQVVGARDLPDRAGAASATSPPGFGDEAAEPGSRTSIWQRMNSG